jgi:hypothetical protein
MSGKLSVSLVLDDLTAKELYRLLISSDSDSPCLHRLKETLEHTFFEELSIEEMAELTACRKDRA